MPQVPLYCIEYTHGWSLLYTCRYDVMAGFNGQEGLYIYTLLQSYYPDVDISKGLTREFADRWMIDVCANYITPTSPALCQDFLKTKYLLKWSKWPVPWVRAIVTPNKVKSGKQPHFEAIADDRSNRVDDHSYNQVIILQNLLTTMLQLNPISTFVAEIQKKQSWFLATKL